MHVGYPQSWTFGSDRPSINSSSACDCGALPSFSRIVSTSFTSCSRVSTSCLASWASFSRHALRCLATQLNPAKGIASNIVIPSRNRILNRGNFDVKPHQGRLNAFWDRTSHSQAHAPVNGSFIVAHLTGRMEVADANTHNPLAMPADLMQAHEQLDRAVEMCYRPKPCSSDRDPSWQEPQRPLAHGQDDHRWRRDDERLAILARSPESKDFLGRTCSSSRNRLVRARMLSLWEGARQRATLPDFVDFTLPWRSCRFVYGRGFLRVRGLLVLSC